MGEFSICVAIADDHSTTLLGVSQVLEGVSTVSIVGTAQNSTQLIELLDQKTCHVLVTDYSMRGGVYGDGLILLEYLQRRYPDLKIVVLTMIDNPSVLRRIILNGIYCIISKADDTSHLIPAVHVACSGGRYFSPTIAAIVQTFEFDKLTSVKPIELSKRELEVIRQYAAGQSISEIAVILNRSKQTISSQKNSAMRKLGIKREADLFKYAMEIGLRF